MWTDGTGNETLTIAQLVELDARVVQEEDVLVAVLVHVTVVRRGGALRYVGADVGDEIATDALHSLVVRVLEPSMRRGQVLAGLSGWGRAAAGARWRGDRGRLRWNTTELEADRSTRRRLVHFVLGRLDGALDLGEVGGLARTARHLGWERHRPLDELN